MIEVASRSNRKRDLVDKVALYRELECAEYWILDSYAEANCLTTYSGDDWGEQQYTTDETFYHPLVGSVIVADLFSQSNPGSPIRRAVQRAERLAQQHEQLIEEIAALRRDR